MSAQNHVCVCVCVRVQCVPGNVECEKQTLFECLNSMHLSQLLTLSPHYNINKHSLQSKTNSRTFAAFNLEMRKCIDTLSTQTLSPITYYNFDFIYDIMCMRVRKNFFSKILKVPQNRNVQQNVCYGPQNFTIMNCIVALETKHIIECAQTTCEMLMVLQLYRKTLSLLPTSFVICFRMGIVLIWLGLAWLGVSVSVCVGAISLPDHCNQLTEEGQRITLAFESKPMMQKRFAHSQRYRII